MHGLNTIAALNARAEAKSENEALLREELAHVRAMLEGAPQKSGYEVQLLHWAKILQRVAAGESFAHVASEVGPTWK